MHKGVTKKGFTLVELALSIAFIAVLSITVALIISNTVATYHRGVILNLVNTAGMDLVDNIRASIQNAQARSTQVECTGSNSNFECGVWWHQTGNVTVNTGGNTNLEVPLYGAFCTGSYSYIWNSGYFWNTEAVVKNASRVTFTYRSDTGNGNPVTVENFKIIKVGDEDRAVCAAMPKGSSIDISSNAYNSLSEDEQPVELLGSGGDSGNDKSLAGLAIYDLSAQETEGETLNNTFYMVSFILGTIQGGIQINASNDYCKTDLDYCAINKFNFAAQANGG